MAKSSYYIAQWTWDADAREYNPTTVAEGKELERLRTIFDSMVATVDTPLIELIEMGEDEDKRLDYKEA